MSGRLASAADRLPGPTAARAVALVAVLVALGASLQVMYGFIDVVGLPSVFLGVVAASLLAATALARVVRPRTAVLVGTIALAVGLGWYLTRLGDNPPWAALLADALSLFTGRSLLRISNVRTWVLGVAPAPVFLTWYFAVGRRYTPAVAVAGGTLGFFVLTGDADVVTTSTGVVAGAAALGVGDVERRNGSVARAETVLVVVAAMIVVPSVVSVVPATTVATGPLAPDLGGAGTVEGSLLDADEEMTVQGDISLSPAVRFTVRSDASEYWRVGSYDRYAGDGWVRTGGTEPYTQGDRRRGPIGSSRTLEQTVTIRSRTNAIPAAWRPIRLTGVDSARTRSDGSFSPGEPLANGTTYVVTSQVPDPSRQRLQSAGRDYPDSIEETYTQLPASTPDRVETRTERLTADAETPYETARVIEQYLENAKSYSLDVDRPRGDVADSFLFEMDEGYCTYYATTMVTMLRTQGVPARFVVGYTAGERVDENEWVVRGLDSHAWVEVYLPDVGWVKFDPTPAGPREQAEQRNVQQSREEGTTDVDASEASERSEWTPTDTDTPVPLTTVPDEPSEPEPGGTPTPPPNVVGGVVTDTGLAGQTTVADGDDEGFDPRLPSRRQLALALVALVGCAVGVRRSGAGERAYRAVWLRYQPRADPASDVERAFQRLLYHLGRERYRRRRESETVREYLDAVDAGEDARRVAAIRERARYRGDVDESDADEAVGLVNRLVR